jgi:glycosyltransferase involved in cell wall biosynthesis
MGVAPAVSVVISSFNRAHALRAAVRALIDQDVPPGLEFEIIVVDNNSTDETPRVVSELAALSPRVRYVFERRQGVSYGRNAGIRAARAPIVAFTDDDNVAAREWVARVHETFEEHPEAAAAGGRVLPRWIGAPPAWLDNRHWSPLAILDYGSRPFYTSAEDPRCLLSANLAVRRKVFSTIGEFSPRFPRCQDHELLIRLWRAGARVLYTPALVVYAPVEAERLTRRYHRTWHATHGHFTASMQLQEIINSEGRLLPEPAEVPRLFGSPGYVYRAAVSHVRAWLLAAIRRDRSGTVDHAHRLRYFASYILQTARIRARRGGAIAEAFGFVRAHVARRLQPTGMSAGRFTAVHLLIAALIGASAYDIATGTEHWPVSPYPMFANVEHEAVLDSVRLYGVVADGSAREIPLLDGAVIAPFDQTRLTTALARVAASKDLPRLDAMLRDCLERYERLRSEGAHSGPPLRGVRLYEVHWTLQPDAANVDRPDSRSLVAAVDLGTRVASAGHNN